MVVFALVAAGAGGQTVWYVDGAAAPGGSGHSWADAFSTLGPALAAAVSGDEVRVAAGVYKPGAAPSDSFVVPGNVKVVGGFAGSGGPNPDLRDPATQVTTLSGDLSGNDGPGFANRADNSLHVVTVNAGDGVVLDGLLITGGNTTGVGGGLVIGGGSPTINDCTFASNAAGRGGAIYVSAGLTVTGSIFDGNASNGFDGGAIYRAGSAPNFSVSGCEFRANTASDGSGGAIAFFDTSAGPQISGSTFYGNSAAFGGGVGNLSGGMSMSRCILSGNSATSAGGGVSVNTGTAEIVNCTFEGNTSPQGGGVCLTASPSTPDVRNCILWNNGNGTEAAQITKQGFVSTDPFVNYCCIQGLTGGLGGTGNIGADPLFTNASAEDFTLTSGSPCINAGDPSAAYNDADGSRNDMGAFGSQGGSPDSDHDGLTDAEEAVYGTDPHNPDTDSDGLMDGTEVEMAQGGGCPDPLDADSDGDTLLDGAEVALGTSPCNSDTDGDTVPDNIDPTPTVPGVTGEFLEASCRALADQINASSLSLFSGPNNNANKGRRNALANRATSAANAARDGDYHTAVQELQSLLEKIDGVSPAPDWTYDTPERAALAAEVEWLIALLGM